MFCNVLCPSPPTEKTVRSGHFLPARLRYSMSLPLLQQRCRKCLGGGLPELLAATSGRNMTRHIFQYFNIHNISSSSFVTRTSPTSVSCGAKSATLLLDLHCFGLFPGATSRLHEPPGCHTLSTWQLYKIDQNRSKGEDVGRVSAAATASKVWGKGTAFDTFRDFQKAIESNGPRLSFVRLSLSERHSSLKTVEVFCRAEIMTKVSQPWKCLQWTWRLLKAGQNGQNMLAASCNMFARTWRVFSRCSMSSMDRRLVQCPAVHSPMSGS